jgi:hypothetical protein
METNQTTQSFRALSLASILFGVAGGAFSWWLPLGMVLSLTGLVLGFIDWVASRRRSLDHRLALAGVAIGILTLALNIVIAALGLQLVTFGP